LAVILEPEAGVGDLETVPGRSPLADLPAQLFDPQSGLERFPEGAGLQKEEMLVIEDVVEEPGLAGDSAGLFGQRPDPLQGSRRWSVAAWEWPSKDATGPGAEAWSPLVRSRAEV